MIPPIVLLFLFNSIFGVEYDLFDGVEKNFTDIKGVSLFSFYIEASVNQAVYISLNLQLEKPDINVKDPFLSPSIAEYSKRNYYPSYTINNIRIANKNINSYFECSILYKISLSSTKYVSLQFKPFSNFSYIVGKVDIIDGVYNLNNGITKTISNLKEKETYLFYAQNFFEGQINKFNLYMNYMNYTPFLNVYIEEYDYKRLISTNSINISIPILSKDNQL